MSFFDSCLVSRGDLAALLIDEMKLDKLFAGRIPVRSNSPSHGWNNDW